MVKEKNDVVKTLNVRIVVKEATVLAGRKERISALPTNNLVINAENKVIFARFVDPTRKDHLMKLKTVTRATVIKLVLWCSVQK